MKAFADVQHSLHRSILIMPGRDLRQGYRTNLASTHLPAAIDQVVIETAMKEQDCVRHVEHLKCNGILRGAVENSASSTRALQFHSGLSQKVLCIFRPSGLEVRRDEKESTRIQQLRQITSGKNPGRIERDHMEPARAFKAAGTLEVRKRLHGERRSSAVSTSRSGGHQQWPAGGPGEIPACAHLTSGRGGGGQDSCYHATAGCLKLK